MFPCKTFKSVFSLLESCGKRVGMISLPLCWKTFVILHRKYIHVCWDGPSRLRTCFINSYVFSCLCCLLKYALRPVLLQGLYNFFPSLCSLTFLTIHLHLSKLKRKLSLFSFVLFPFWFPMNWLSRSPSGRAWNMAIFLKSNDGTLEMAYISLCVDSKKDVG